MAAKKATKKTSTKIIKKADKDVAEKDSEVLEGRYVLPRKMEIAEIGNVYKDVQKFSGEAHKKCVLDAGEVALIDTAGIQLIVQLLTTLKSEGCEVSWENDSIQIYQMAAELGLAEQLEA
jgi:anti-anti-sigma regulatory factor